MPDPAAYSSEREWMRSCVPTMIDEGRPQAQAVAACLNIWRRRGEASAADAPFARLRALLEELGAEVVERQGRAFSEQNVQRVPGGGPRGGQFGSGDPGQSAEEPAAPAEPLSVSEAGGVSNKFRRTVDGIVSKIPPPVAQALNDAGTEVMIGDTMFDIEPGLVGEQPRGWPEGFAWDQVGGAFADGKVMIAAAVVSEAGERSELAKGVVERTILHEIGHAYDEALGGISESADFKAAYERDVAKIADHARAKLGYYLQEGEAGRSETFAEGFANLNGRGLALKPHFPETMEFILDTMREPA